MVLLTLQYIFVRTSNKNCVPVRRLYHRSSIPVGWPLVTALGEGIELVVCGDGVLDDADENAWKPHAGCRREMASG